MRRPIDAVVDAIRAAERDATRRLDDARRRADDGVRAAEGESRRLLEEAGFRGDGRAAQRHGEALRDAEDTAAALRADAAIRADALRRSAGPQLHRVAAAMLEFVLTSGVDEEA